MTRQPLGRRAIALAMFLVAQAGLAEAQTASVMEPQKNGRAAASVAVAGPTQGAMRPPVTLARGGLNLLSGDRPRPSAGRIKGVFGGGSWTCGPAGAGMRSYCY